MSVMPRDWQKEWSTYPVSETPVPMRILPTIDTKSLPVSQEEFEQLKKEIAEIWKFLHTHPNMIIK